MNSIEISVIIPVFNVYPYLDQCVSSLLNQDSSNYEILLIDDGSTDGCGELCDRYEKEYPGIRVIHKRHGGIGSARNAGMDLAKGEYILFVDSDDYLRENCLKHLYYIAKKDRLDILLFGAQPFWDDSIPNQGNRTNNYRRTKNINIIMSGRDGVKAAFQNREYITQVCLRLINREFLLATKRRFNERYIHEDEDFALITYMLAKRSEIIADIEYFKRYHQGSIMANLTYQKSLDGYEYAVRQISQFLDSISESSRVYWRRNNYMLETLTTEYCKLALREKRKYHGQLRKLLNDESGHLRFYSKTVKLAHKTLLLLEMVVLKDRILSAGTTKRDLLSTSVNSSLQKR